MKWAIKDQELLLNRIYVMGILNVTPDSFSDGGKYNTPSSAFDHALQLIQAGSDILDIGAESTRPGAEELSAASQIDRLGDLIQRLSRRTTLPLSIDTTRAEVAEYALNQGAHIVNDVSGLEDSGQAMAEVVKKYRAGLVLMHRRGNPGNMQSFARYENVVLEVKLELAERVKTALDYGIAREQIVIDPGIGFSKTTEQSWEVLGRIQELQDLGYPILAGASRKSFLSKIAGEDIENRDQGSLSAHLWAVSQGAAIIRTHEVKKHRLAMDVFENIKRSQDHVRTF